MKLRLIAIIAAGAVCAGAQTVVLRGPGTPVVSTTKTTTVTTTSTDDNTKETTTTVTTTTVKEIAPEDGGYTYVEYEGAWVPYYRGYYYINGVWLWRHHGKPPFPPPHFRPVPHHKHLPKPVPPKPAPRPAPKPAPRPAPHAKVPAPAVPHR